MIVRYVFLIYNDYSFYHCFMQCGVPAFNAKALFSVRSKACAGKTISLAIQNRMPKCQPG